jgi:predicted metal-dependent HD superfamily phosphohydrolase
MFDQLVAADRIPNRHYHSENHVVACLECLANHQDLAIRPNEIEIALWFDNAIYDTHRSDNVLVSVLDATA